MRAIVTAPIIVDSGGGRSMSTLGWVLLIGWLAGVVIATYPCCLLVMKSMLDESTPDQTDWVFGGVIGFCVALLWPLVVFGAIAFWISRRIAEAVVGDDDKEGVDR